MNLNTSVLLRTGVLVLILFTLIALPAPGQTTPVIKGDYVLAEEGTSMNGAFASLSIVKFSDSGAVTGTQVLRTAAQVETRSFLGSLVMEKGNVGTLYLRFETGSGEEVGVEEISYRLVMAQTTIQAIRSTAGSHSTATLSAAMDPEHKGTYIFSEINHGGKANCRIVEVTLDPAGTAAGTAYAAHSVETAMDLRGSFANDEKGFHALTLTMQEEDSEGNVVATTESYVAAWEKDRVVLLRKDSGAVALHVMYR